MTLLEIDSVSKTWRGAEAPVLASVSLAVARGLSEADARQRMAAQIPTAKKIERADFVITTDGSKSESDEQISRLLIDLANRRPTA